MKVLREWVVVIFLALALAFGSARPHPATVPAQIPTGYQLPTLPGGN